MGSSFKDGMFALAEVKYTAGDIKPTVIENATTSTTKVGLTVDNVAGVKVPVFTAETGAHDTSTALIGMAKGGQQIVKAREAFGIAVEVLVKLATLQTSFITLDEAVKVILFRMACALRSSPSQSLSIEGGNLLPPAMKPPKGVSSRRDRAT
jgi:V-type H+-transporting ATPase subunit D